MSEKPRISWISQIANPAAPTAAELARGVPLVGYAINDDGLQFAKDDIADTPQTFPRTVTFYAGPTEPDWIVLRAADDLPPGVMPAALDGLWVNRPPVLPAVAPEEEGSVFAVFVPTSRFEVRDDGTVAEVFEMRP